MIARAVALVRGLWALGFAHDHFVGGGDLVDTRAWYAGRDKVQHIVAAAALAGALRHLLHVDLAGTAGLVLGAGLAIECVEHWRYYWWATRGAGRTFPVLCDRFSWRDLVADAVGLGLGLLLF